jgi:hypothetical protein
LLRRGVRGPQPGKPILEVVQLAHLRVVLTVGDGGCVEHVVAPPVLVQLVRQRRVPSSRRRVGVLRAVVAIWLGVSVLAIWVEVTQPGIVGHRLNVSATTDNGRGREELKAARPTTSLRSSLRHRSGPRDPEPVSRQSSVHWGH